MSGLTIDNLSFAYDNSDAPVLSGIDLTIETGTCAVLLGPSGCGKSTLLRLLAGLETPMSGTITRSANGASDPVAFVFQKPALMPWASVAENIALPLRLSGAGDKSQIASRVESVLAQVGLSGFEARMPASLSGGQAMRVSIARALISGATVLLLDEPFAALDELLRFDLNDLLLGLKKQHNLTIVFVTHSLYEAAYLGDQISILSAGQIAHQIRRPFDHHGPATRSHEAYLGFVADLYERVRAGQAVITRHADQESVP